MAYAERRTRSPQRAADTVSNSADAVERNLDRRPMVIPEETETPEGERAAAAGRAYHLGRAEQESERADGAVEAGARKAHRALEKLHRDRAGSDEPTELLIVRE